MLVDQINWNVDKFIIGRFGGPVPVSVYGVAAMLNSHYLTLSTAISHVFIPRINRMVTAKSSRRDVDDLFLRVGRLQFLILAPGISAFVFFGKPFVTLWAGPEYTDAYYVGLLLMVPLTLPLIQNLGLEIQKALDLHRFRSVVFAAIAALNIALSIPLTRLYGPVGAAAATAVALILGNVIVMNWYYHARIRLRVGYFWLQILRLSLGMLPALAIGALGSVTMELTQLSSLILAGLTYIFVYALGMWWLGMNHYERHLFGGLARRLTSRRFPPKRGD